MTSFSQRKGIKKIKTEIQREYIDSDLRNKLWNLLGGFYFGEINGIGNRISDFGELDKLFKIMWHNYLRLPIDEMPKRCDGLYETIKDYFFRCQWNEVYDFLEFVANNYPNENTNNSFKEACNAILKEELSAYRFVGNEITEVTSEKEITEIEQAMETPLHVVNTHIENGLKLMSDKKSPDYRNSIKESISAVEAICRVLVGNKNATLGQALDTIEKMGKIELNKALKEAFDHLYGFTSGSEGIRHALLEEKVGLDFEDAKFMLVSCSAFVNFLVVKASKAGLELA